MYKRRWLNVLLPLIGIGIVIFYTVCGGSCSYLKGDILGVNLTYVGIVSAVVLAVLALLRRDLLFLTALSAGVGTELFLIGFQVKTGVYCPYCLMFAGILFLLFVLNFEVSRMKLMVVAALCGLLFFAVFFHGTTTPVYAQELLTPSFGTGKVKVRIYTDYFCGPCARLEPKLEPMLVNLVKNNAITLVFVDTPVHDETPLYARYFLFALNEKKEFEHAIRVRNVLFEAAKNKLSDKDRLEEYLKKQNIKFKSFDTKPVFALLSTYLREDGIDRTPMCVIYNGVHKGTYKGAEEITKAIELLK